jgi:hypothetical protein
VIGTRLGWLLQQRFRLVAHNRAMIRIRFILAVALALGIAGTASLYAQETEPVGDQDGSSERVEQTDEAFRRQMELEDARSKDRTYVDTTYTEKIDQEKIDKLPEGSRDNIRDQLVDVIMENGDWEPKDALEEYPYQPSAEAQSDAELEEQEQEAWDEQIQKYHEREAAAFGSHKGPVPGPGNPTGQEGGEQGEGSQGQQGQQGGEQGSGQGGRDGERDANTAGTYQPGASGSEDETSTAGVSESALDFLKSGRTGSQQQNPASSSDMQAQAQSEESQQDSQEQLADPSQQQAPEQEQAQSEESQQESQEQVAEQSPQQTPEQEQTEQEEQQASQQDIPLDTRGIIPIRDLDKLEGTGSFRVPQIPQDPEDSEDP